MILATPLPLFTHLQTTVNFQFSPYDYYSIQITECTPKCSTRVMDKAHPLPYEQFSHFDTPHILLKNFNSHNYNGLRVLRNFQAQTPALH